MKLSYLLTEKATVEEHIRDSIAHEVVRSLIYARFGISGDFVTINLPTYYPMRDEICWSYIVNDAPEFSLVFKGTALDELDIEAIVEAFKPQFDYNEKIRNMKEG